MPTRKDNTNVAPIYREQVFIPASGATLIKQKARPKIVGRPVSSGAIEIVSPEFDLLTGARGLLNMINPNRAYANIGNGSNMTMFDGATTTNEAVKQGIREARDYVRHPVIVETVERNKELAERISGKSARNMGWFTDGNRVPANTRAEVLQHYIDRPVHIQTSNDLPKGFLGDYTSANTRIRVKSGLNPYDTKRVVFHEGLHHSGYGNFEGGLYDLKAEKLFGIDDYLLGHEAAVNTAELGRMMGLKLGQKYPGIQTFKNMIAKYNVEGFDKKFIFDKAILNTPRDYKRFWDALTGKYFTAAGATATGLNLANNDKMKCGGRRKAQLGLDIREGGIAIPIAPNMYYMNGRSHNEGGIGIGPNNKNGLEVEGGEVVKVGDNDIKVFSSVPLLRGVSPAQLVMGGANPNKVFKAQEEFKDRNRINDDGTRYQNGGNKVIKYENLPSSFKGKRVNGRILQGGVPPVLSRGELAIGNPLQRMSMWSDDLGEFSKYMARRIHKFVPKKVDTAYRYIVDYLSNKGPNNAIDNNAENLTKAISLFNAHEYKTGGIYIKPSKRGTFTAAAKKRGMGVQEFASKVLANKEDYSPAMIKKANFARNASRWKKELGGSMIYTINGNVKNGLMSARPKAQYGLATKYLKKRNNSDKQKSENISNNKTSYNVKDGLKIGLGTVGGLGVAGITSYGLTKLENYLNEVTRPSLEISQKALDEYNEKYVRKTQGKTTKNFVYRNPLRRTTNYQATVNEIIGDEAANKLYKQITSFDDNLKRIRVGEKLNPNKIKIRDVQPIKSDKVFSELSNAEQRKLDKDYRRVVGNKEPKSGFGAKPASKVITAEYPNTSISSKPVNVVGETYDPTVEFRQAAKPKTAVNNGLNHYLKKLSKGIKGIGVIGSLLDIYNNLFPSEEAEVLENLRVRMNKTNKELTSRRQTKYGGRIKAENGKFLKYKNGIFTDPETGEEFEVDPEVFKMYGNTKESGVIPIADYTKGTFDNARPQYYAEKRLPIAGSQSIAEKAGLSRSGWSYADNKPISLNYIPNINLSIPTNYGKSSAPRKGGNKATTSNSNVTPAKISSSKIDLSKAKTPTFDVSQLSSKETKAAKAKLNTPSTGGGKQGRWIGQYKPVTTADWIGLGSNLAGTVASYFMTKNTINKMPDPVKPIMAQAAKLKTRYNVEPQLTNIREAEQMNRAAVRRNTQSSNVSLAREQRLMNEARGARNQLYSQKENIETQLINQDRLNRQSVMRDNVRAYNDYLNRLTGTRQSQNQLRISNINNLLSGLTGSVNNILGTIESRRATNNTLRAIAAANPNVDARLIGGFDYYIDPITKRKYNKNQQYVGTING